MINGTSFETFARNGYSILKGREQVINDLNVFPVSDGDTGTNMCLTLGHGLKYAESTDDLGAYMKKLSRGMLLGARGNSGVIFSQLVRGMATALAGHAEADTLLFAAALKKGYETAYAAVKHPAEGTILTVAREGIERILPSLTAETDTDHMLKLYLASLRQTLDKTPDLLPVLKEAGVVDSGGMGLVAFFEGFVPAKEMPFCPEPQRPDRKLQQTPADEGDHGYRTEFVLHPETGFFSLEELGAYLESKGSSIVVTQDADLVKVHMHTAKPLDVLNFVSAFGTFYSFKVDNLSVICRQQEQRVAHINQKEIRERGIAYVAVAQGDGLIDILQELGCDIVINGGQTMNTSAEEFADAFSLLPAEHIIVLPNDGNVLLAARQGAELCGRGNIHILPTHSVAEGYFAMSMRLGDVKDVEKQLHSLEQGMRGVRTLQVARAAADRTIGGISCHQGDAVVLLDRELAAAGQDRTEAVLTALAGIPNLGSLGTCVIFRGQEMDGDACEETAQRIMEAYPDLACGVLDGGQDVYDMIIGVTE